jgi:hypothetical protein
VDAVIQAVLRYLVVDLGAKAGQATESRLHMAAGAAETIVKVEVAEGGIKVVTPHQADNTPPEPDAFGVAGRAIDDLCRFGKFIGLALVILGRIGCGCRVLPGLVGVRGRPTLGERAACAKHQGQSGNDEVAQNRKPTLKQTLTHKFPDLVPDQAPFAAQIGPECGGSAYRNPMTEILDFCKQTRNFIALW